MSVLGDPIMSRFAMAEDHDHHDEDHDSYTDEDPSKVLIAKGVTMVVLCSVSICMGLFPMQLAKWLKWNTSGQVSNPRSMKVVGLLLGFGGGVLFCTTFLHLLPEVKEGVEHLIQEDKLPYLRFSWAETLSCTGFFLMYLVEESVHAYLRKKEINKEEDTKKDVNRSTNELVENGQTMQTCPNGHTNGHGHSHHIPMIMDDSENDFIVSSLRGLLIVLGLSVHELFEGLAIGLESSPNYVWYMFAAVAAHKFVIAFCIGVELLAAKTRRYLSIIYICTFAVVSPLGIGIGMLLVGGGSAAASGPLAVILQGLASGTLLYVVFFEILQEHRTGLHQYMSIITGFILMFGLQILSGVLLFTTFLHLAPEVRASVERHQSNGQLPKLGTLSLAELLFCTGFFMVYLVEEAVHAALTGKPESSEALLYRTVSVRRRNNSSNQNSAITGSTTTVATTTTWKDDSEDDESLDSGKTKFKMDDRRGKDDKVLPAIFVLSSSLLQSESHQNAVKDQPNLESNYSVKHHGHSHHHHGMSKNNSIQGLLTVLALSFHAIFEGLAVGLEPSIGSVVYLAAAIATHKSVISFCVGMELYVAGASTRTTLSYLTIFSMVTPIGIAVGLALSYFKNDSENLGPTPTILQGMAAGTLLYVVFFEVLARERANEKSGLLQLAAIIVGFMLMLGLQIATAHSHSHGGHGHSHEHNVIDHDHDHDDHAHEATDHNHANTSTENLLSSAIDRVTESIADAVSTALSSSTSTPRTMTSHEHS